MPRKYINYKENPQWDDPKKVESRIQTIILPGRRLYGKSIPKDKQYWTLCGQHWKKDETGKITKAEGEFGQIIKSKLITKDQFYGVDRDENTIKLNKQFYPNVNWYCGDFKGTMSNASIEGTFNPAIINFDSTTGIEWGISYLKPLLMFIDYNVNDKLLLLVNLLFKNPYRKDKEHEGTEMIERLKKRYLFPDHWSVSKRYYRYLGTGDRSHSIMGTIAFVKKAHEKITITKNRNLFE